MLILRDRISCAQITSAATKTLSCPSRRPNWRIWKSATQTWEIAGGSAPHKENIRYVHAWKTWIIWTDQWKRDGQDAIMVLADDTVESMWREANDLANRDAQSKLRRLAHKSEALARRIAMVAGAQKDVALSVDKIDADPMLLGVENGVIDLRDGSFRAARREDFITKRCKVAYDPAARCPRWLEFLATIFPPDMPPYVQRVVGYTR